MSKWRIGKVNISLTKAVVALASAASVAIAAEPVAASPIQKTVFYSGHVQGVGFRATAQAMARKCKVTGWVKNLDDGRVQLVVEGEATEVGKFLDRLTKEFENNIARTVVKEKKAGGQFRDFEIRR